jgi:hypothetical protein
MKWLDVLIGVYITANNRIQLVLLVLKMLELSLVLCKVELFGWGIGVLSRLVE